MTPLDEQERRDAFERRMAPPEAKPECGTTHDGERIRIADTAPRLNRQQRRAARSQHRKKD